MSHDNHKIHFIDGRPKMAGNSSRKKIQELIVRTQIVKQERRRRRSRGRKKTGKEITVEVDFGTALALLHAKEEQVHYPSQNGDRVLIRMVIM